MADQKLQELAHRGARAKRPAWEAYENLRFILNATTKKIDGGTVVYTDKDGREQTIKADSVVVCGGMKPLREEAMSFAGLTEKYFAIGDCNKVGNIQACTSEAYARAMIL
jgi:thioredoxin reductase